MENLAVSGSHIIDSNNHDIRTKHHHIPLYIPALLTVTDSALPSQLSHLCISVSALISPIQPIITYACFCLLLDNQHLNSFVLHADSVDKETYILCRATDYFRELCHPGLSVGDA